MVSRLENVHRAEKYSVCPDFPMKDQKAICAALAGMRMISAKINLAFDIHPPNFHSRHAIFHQARINHAGNKPYANPFLNGDGNGFRIAQGEQYVSIHPLQCRDFPGLCARRYVSRSFLLAQ